MSGLSALLWPRDLPPPPNLGIRVHKLPPIVHTGFFATENKLNDLPKVWDLPETYILYQGPVDRATISRLLDAWSWADGPIGEYYPLLIAGLTHNLSKGMMDQVRSRFGAASSVQALPPLNPLTLPLLYHRSTAVFNLGSIPAWGNAARNALACAKPFVAVSSTEIEVVVGPAAYLLPEGNARTLGAALITVVVEDSLAEQLSIAARERSSAWDASKFRDSIGETYENISRD
jgi:glycosyltransferase involved in cell wall biosynthesis